MRKTIKTMLRMLIVLVLLSSMPALPACASAAKVRCYTISSGKTTVYGNSSLTRKCGTVTGSQEIKVLSVSRKYCKISYTGPDKKTKTGYISTRAILCGTGGESCKIKEKLKAYRRPGGKSSGSIPRGTRIKILGTSGKYTQVQTASDLPGNNFKVSSCRRELHFLSGREFDVFGGTFQMSSYSGWMPVSVPGTVTPLHKGFPFLSEPGPQDHTFLRCITPLRLLKAVYLTRG